MDGPVIEGFDIIADVIYIIKCKKCGDYWESSETYLQESLENHKNGNCPP